MTLKVLITALILAAGLALAPVGAHAQHWHGGGGFGGFHGGGGGFHGGMGGGGFHGGGGWHGGGWGPAIGLGLGALGAYGAYEYSQPYAPACYWAYDAWGRAYQVCN